MSGTVRTRVWILSAGAVSQVTAMHIILHEVVDLEKSMFRRDNPSLFVLERVSYCPILVPYYESDD